MEAPQEAVNHTFEALWLCKVDIINVSKQLPAYTSGRQAQLLSVFMPKKCRHVR